MAFYADFAGHYEKIFPFRPAVAEFLDHWLPAEGRILDIGCGTGHYCAALDGTGRRTLGVDLDPGMIREASRAYPGGEFRILGMEEIGLLPKEGFSGVFCIGNVLPHLPAHRLAGFLVDVHSLLEPGGVWVFQTVNFDPIMDDEDFIFPEINLTSRPIAWSSTRAWLDPRVRFLPGKCLCFHVPAWITASGTRLRDSRSWAISRISPAAVSIPGNSPAACSSGANPDHWGTEIVSMKLLDACIIGLILLQS